MTDEPTPSTPADDPTASGAIEPRHPGDLTPLDPSALPPAELPAAAPPAPARALAFASIVIGGLCGGLIGFAFTDLQCTDGCAELAGLGALIGALVGAIGVAVVAVLVLRAMDEWQSTQKRERNRQS